MEATYSTQDWVYEKIYATLFEAISNSDEVKKVLGELQEKNLIQNIDVINLILSLDELSQLSGDLIATQEAAGLN
jgi:hypothetical protein|tara:strand:+ start:427 stop:651 length:225 start_codon:yes stop_codon:yes gene_type:complete